MRRTIAVTINELPVLQEGWVRMVHLTNRLPAEIVAAKGLDYARHLIVDSTARCYWRAEDACYTHTDPRFSGAGMRAVVLDVPDAEVRLHQWRDKSKPPPGIVPAKYVVGILKAE